MKDEGSSFLATKSTRKTEGLSVIGYWGTGCAGDRREVKSKKVKVRSFVRNQGTA